jgi:hypothetical protein
MPHFLFHLCFDYNYLSDNQNQHRRKNVVCVLGFFLLNRMNVRLFWHQRAWLEILMMRTRLLKTWGLVVLIVLWFLFFLGAALVSSLYYLQIEMLLPHNRRIEGTLQNYNLHSNVALISVKDYCACHPLNTVVATDFFWSSSRRALLRIMRINGYQWGNGWLDRHTRLQCPQAFHM